MKIILGRFKEAGFVLGMFILAILFTVVYLPGLFLVMFISLCLTTLDIPIWLFTGKAPFCGLFSKLERHLADR